MEARRDAGRAGALMAGLAAAVALSGCAATATGTARSAMVTEIPPAPLRAEAPAGTVLVTVRYPAMVETDAEAAYQDAFLRSPIGGRVSGDLAANPDARNIAGSVIIKSNYFALSLYKELAERLPDHGVLLSPHAISLDDAGALTSTPITEAEQIPSVLTVDFATYSFPDPDRMMQAEPLTFGDLITPLIVVHTDHRAAPPNQGVLMASSPLLRHAGGTATEAVHGSLERIEAGRFDSPPRELDFIAFLTRGETRGLPTQPLSFGQTVNAAQLYPMEKLVLDRAALARLGSVGQKVAAKTSDVPQPDPLERVFSGALADRITTLLNTIDAERAAMVQRAAAVHQFDPTLAALSITGLPDPDYLARIRFAERLMDAQRKYLSIQSLRIYDGIHNGEVGRQVREMLLAEWDVIEKRRDLAQQQNMATALAIAGAVAGGVAVASSGDTFDAGDFLLVDLLTDAAILATMHAISTNRQSATVGANYLASIVPALEEQTSIQVNLIESSETITAIRYEDLQVRLQEMYAENQRAIDTIATRCGYAHEGAAPIGVWQGECAGGLAEGAGVGVVRQEDGTAIEYFGEARQGRPHGTGLLIRHVADGSQAIEGNFMDGRPGGVVRVSRPGMADALRLFENGYDIGPAPFGASAPRLFDAPAPPRSVTEFQTAGATP